MMQPHLPQLVMLIRGQSKGYFNVWEQRRNQSDFMERSHNSKEGMGLLYLMKIKLIKIEVMAKEGNY